MNTIIKCNKIKIAIVILSILFTGCQSQGGVNPSNYPELIEYSEMLSRNRGNLIKLSLGMNKNQVINTMGIFDGDTNNGRVPNPAKSEMIVRGSDNFEILFYMTEKYPPFTAIRDSQATPVVLKNNHVIGWGWQVAEPIIHASDKPSNSNLVKYKAVGSFDDYNEVLLGDVDSDLDAGTSYINVIAKNSKIKCEGQSYITYMPPSLACAGQQGEAPLRCTDGRELTIKWVASSCITGFGVGTDQNGATFHFAYGLDEDGAKAELEKNVAHVAKNPDFPVYRPKEFRKEKGFSTGTGFFVTNNGYMVTNFHVIDGATSVAVISPSENKGYPATVVQTDPNNDIAILKVEAKTIGIPLASSFSGAKGEEVFTLGFPLVAQQGQEIKATFGRINSLSGIQGDVRFIQVDVPIQPGNSGGPLFNSRGEVIGVVTATLDQFVTLKASGHLPQNVNYAVKIDYITPVLNSAKVNRRNVHTTLSSKPSLVQVVSQRESSVMLVVAQ